MFRLGITGGIGSGKSSVSGLLAAYCPAPLVNIDHCCRSLMDVERPGWSALRSQYGSRFFLPDGEVNRQLLRETLFADPDIRRQIDALIHPLAREAMQQQLASCRSSLVLIEIPLLYEAGWREDVDEVLVVYARRGAQCCRIMRRDGVSRRAACRSIRAQMDLGEKARLADYVIDNSGPWRLTRAHVVDFGETLAGRFLD